MCYRSTPCTSTGTSPAELLMGRKIKTKLPTLEKNLLPQWPDLKAVRSKDVKEKEKQAFYSNLRHGARPLPSLRPGNPVLVKLDHQNAWGTPADIAGDSATPRSYVVETQQGTKMRRNRRHLQRDQLYLQGDSYMTPLHNSQPLSLLLTLPHQHPVPVHHPQQMDCTHANPWTD